MAAHRVLVVDDDAELRDMICDILEEEGYLCFPAATARQSLQLFEAKDFDAVLLDLRLPDMSGQEVLQDMVEARPDIPVVIISAHGSVPGAVDAVRAGAHNFLEKPLETDRLLISVRNALASRKLRLERDGLIERLREEYRMIGVSDALTKICASIDRVARTTATVLITGETGVGKELVARAIYTRSDRTAKPFVRVNCAAIPDELIESELFGHQRGAFTGATATQKGKFHHADGGTLFMDEVADMSPKTQAKVLRAIESGEVEMVGAAQPEIVDVRIIAATNKHLNEEVSEGRFRQDLYYRFNTVRIDVPPLRDRKDDIVPLAEFFFLDFAERHNRLRKQLTPSGEAALRQHAWPGNVRELRNLMEHLTLMADPDSIEGKQVAEALAATGTETSMTLPDTTDFRQTVHDFERSLLIRTMETHDWNVADAAKALNLTTPNLYKKLSSHNLKHP